MATYLDWLALHSSILDRYIRGEEEIAAGMIRGAYTDAVQQLSTMGMTTVTDAEREAVLAAILAALVARIQNSWGTMQERIANVAYWDQDERAEVMLAGAERNSPEFQMVLAIVAAQVVQGMAAGRWWQRQAQWAADSFGQQVRLGAAAREAMSATIARIMGTTTSASAFYRSPTGEVLRRAAVAGGVMASTERNVRALVSMTTLKSVADMNRMMMLANPGMFEAIQHVSVLDDRTTEVCHAYDGKVFSLPGFVPIGHSLAYGSGVPRHWNCRSAEMPIVRSSDFFSRAPARWDYYKWAEKQTDTVKKQIMGVRQYRAYKAGALSLRETVSLASSAVLQQNSRTKSTFIG